MRDLKRAAFDLFFRSASIRQLLWRAWYPFLTRRLRRDDALFLNYAYEEAPPVGLPLSAADERDRACLQLYHRVLSQAELAGRDVLEVSCGHGGGASYAARAFKPRRYVGLDLNPAGVRFCRSRHRAPGLAFVLGNAQALPFPAASFDAVVNVEASHCYPRFDRFVAEAARVLRPGGALLYADFRFREDVPAWRAALAAPAFSVDRDEDITAAVLRGMDLNGPRSEAMVDRLLPQTLRRAGRDFAGVPGSRVYEAFRTGRAEYRALLLRKRP